MASFEFCVVGRENAGFGEEKSAFSKIFGFDEWGRIIKISEVDFFLINYFL